MGSPSMEDNREDSVTTPIDPPNSVLNGQNSEAEENENENPTGIPRDVNDVVEYNSSRRGSLPTGLVEHHLNPNILCGKILRFIGDEHYSKACGKHLRFMGDEMCYSYLLRNRFNSNHSSDSQLQNSQSLPDLSTLAPK